jgi:hypothetical protein
MAQLRRIVTAAGMVAATLAVVGRSPRDFLLAVRIGWFVRHLPADLARRDLGSFLHQLRRPDGKRRQTASDVRAQAPYIRRIAMAVLSLPGFWRWNTCYVRALVIYHFLPAGENDVQLHIGIEQRGPQRALHGHAWLTLGDELIEAPDDVMLGSLREIPLYARA